jgi:hypothetical protein
MKEALSSSDTSVLAGATQRNIPECAILHYRILNTEISHEILPVEQSLRNISVQTYPVLLYRRRKLGCNAIGASVSLDIYTNLSIKFPVTLRETFPGICYHFDSWFVSSLYYAFTSAVCFCLSLWVKRRGTHISSLHYRRRHVPSCLLFAYSLIKNKNGFDVNLLFGLTNLYKNLYILWRVWLEAVVTR